MAIPLSLHYACCEFRKTRFGCTNSTLNVSFQPLCTLFEIECTFTKVL